MARADTSVAPSARLWHESSNIDPARTDGISQPQKPPNVLVDDGTDHDNDADVDCADADCDGTPACREVCNDGVDNDADGDTDCADSDCVGTPACREVCADGTDNDLDGDVDCVDTDCLGAPECAPCGNGTVDPGEQCDDNNTDNGDGCNSLCFDERVDGNVGGVFDGAFPTGQEVAYFFTVHNAPTQLRAATSDGNGGCPPGDTIIDVVDVGNGRRVVATDDDGGPGLCSLLSRAIAPGSYEIVVRAFLGQAHAGYVLDLDLYVDVNAPGVYDGGFGAGQYDLYRFQQVAPAPLHAQTSDGGGGCPGDTVMILSAVVDGVRNEVARDDDGGDSPCSALDIESLDVGSYELRVLGADALVAYRLSVAHSPPPFCGDGNVDPGEECDDGNNEPNDHCDADCFAEPFCGDGALDDGEECDAGDNDPGDRCDPDCAVEPYCGDGALDDGEECDDGGELNGDGCSRTCQLEQGCGNGTVADQEQCDDDNLFNGDGCNALCFDERVERSATTVESGGALWWSWTSRRATTR